MPDCTQTSFEFPSFDRRKIEGSFDGGNVSSDGGVMLLRQADRKTGLTAALDKVIADPRNPDRTTHRQIDLLRQRIYGIASGYEDLNDHDSLRSDALWQTAVDRAEELASSPTLCRMENRADRKTAWAISQILVEQFVASFKVAPNRLILDFDATDDRVHGQQQGRAFHGYYGDWCFLPLYVFCGEQLLVSYLRPSNIDTAKHSWAILKLLVSRLRQAWPGVQIIFRADSGFCRWKMLRWCERSAVDYVVGLAQNSRLLAMAKSLMDAASACYEEERQKQRFFGWANYAAKSWDRERPVIIKAEHTEKGSNPRFVVTSLREDEATSLCGNAQQIYDEVYCARGEMENRIKEQQLGLFSDRTSCSQWWPNQLRLLFSAAAYVLIETVRRLGLHGTELARAQVSTIRLKLFKIGTVIVRNTRRIRLLFSSSYPWQPVFLTALHRLSTV